MYLQNNNMLIIIVIICANQLDRYYRVGYKYDKDRSKIFEKKKTL